MEHSFQWKMAFTKWIPSFRKYHKIDGGSRKFSDYLNKTNVENYFI